MYLHRHRSKVEVHHKERHAPSSCHMQTGTLPWPSPCIKKNKIVIWVLSTVFVILWVHGENQMWFSKILGQLLSRYTDHCLIIEPTWAAQLQLLSILIGQALFLSLSTITVCSSVSYITVTGYRLKNSHFFSRTQSPYIDIPQHSPESSNCYRC